MQIGVVGAGPAGSWASVLLARQGHSVTLMDSHAPWEKPCGGGITTKALSSFPVFESDLPRNNIDQITVYFGDMRSVTLSPRHPLAVVSRHELSAYLIREAERSGVTISKTRVNRIERAPSGWVLYTRDTSMQFDFLIGADGASSLVRRSVSTPLPPEDLAVTMGYFIPGKFPPHMKIYFLPEFEGYIWSFPRPTHISYGLISRSGPGWTGRARGILSNFIAAELGAEIFEQAEFYSAPVPCLDPRSWKNNRVAGEGWALVGDAAGLSDPVTGEGIYYAFKSAVILAETFQSPQHYAHRIETEITRELARASRMYRRFYRGRFLGADFKMRMVQLSSRSRTLKSILGNLISGNQSYLSLKKKLAMAAPSVLLDLVLKRA